MLTNLNLYHGTSKESFKSIMKNGMEENFGRFGVGRYFFTDRSEAMKWGSEIYMKSVDIEDLMVLDYEKDMIKLFPELNIEEEEGEPRLREHVLSEGFDGAIINYSDGVQEAIIYK